MSQEITQDLELLQKELEQHNHVGTLAYYWSDAILRLLRIVDKQNIKIEELEKDLEKQKDHYHRGSYLHPRGI